MIAPTPPGAKVCEHCGRPFRVLHCVFWFDPEHAFKMIDLYGHETDGLPVFLQHVMNPVLPIVNPAPWDASSAESAPHTSLTKTVRFRFVRLAFGSAMDTADDALRAEYQRRGELQPAVAHYVLMERPAPGSTWTAVGEHLAIVRLPGELPTE